MGRARLGCLLLAVATACEPSLGDIDDSHSDDEDSAAADTMQLELIDCASNEDCPSHALCSPEIPVCEINWTRCRGNDCGGPGRGVCDGEVCACEPGHSAARVSEFCCAVGSSDDLCDGVEPQNGFAGGPCRDTPPSTCQHESLVCNADENYCYDPENPCFGVECGGSDRGTCTVATNGLPQCECQPGFTIVRDPLKCCPADGNGCGD